MIYKKLKKNLKKIIEYYLCGFSYVLGLKKVYGKPPVIFIETTNICNFRCIYCPQSNHEDHFANKKQKVMDFETYKEILKKVVSKHTKIIVLSRDGEPFLNKNIEEFIEFTKRKYNVHIEMASNGSLITEERAESIIKAGLDQMKGDISPNKNRFEEIRQNSIFENSMNGYLNIVKAAKKINPKFRLIIANLETYNMTDQQQIKESNIQLLSFFKGYEDIVNIMPAIMHNSLNESKVTLSSSFKCKEKSQYNLCHHPFFQLVIDAEANVSACCRDLRSEYIVGNVLETTNFYKEVWNSPKYMTLRKFLIKKQPQQINICSKCDLPYGFSYAGKGILNKFINFIR